ncbi:hypothetical protein BC332_04418 [Capsicum chinense]|nr:hypothetical protein BC332_04418 [Capsicum chinense]
MDLKFVSISFAIFILLHSSKTTFADQFTNQNDLETYIVQLELPEDFVFSDSKDLYLWHQSFLPTTISDHSSRIIYSYRHVLNGFSARLSPDEVKVMETKPGFVSVRPQRTLQLQTTRSPSFLGLHQNVGLWKASNYGKGVIIGLLDSGITPKHPSFNDNGMPPPPAKWKGLIVNDVFQVAAIIENLQPIWKDFKNYLKHKRKEMIVEDLIVREKVKREFCN